MKRALFALALIGGLWVGNTWGLEAENSPTLKAVRFGVLSLLKFSISSNSVTWPNLTPELEYHGFPSALKVTVKSNDADTHWYVSTYASGPFRSLADATLTFDVSMLSFKLSSAATYQSMGLSAQTVTSGGKGEFALWMDYQLQLTWDIQAANDYKTSVVYQVSVAP